MRLYIMRHGPAEDYSSTGRDEDRALTPTGRERVREVARLLAREGEMPVRVLTSRLIRARETADIVLARAKVDGGEGNVETVHELAPGGQSFELAQRLARESAASPILVGHEPDLSSLVERLLGAPPPLPMDKAMVVALELSDAQPATLRFIIEPRSTAIVHDNRSR
jgi:phosphohistidine phosphatase